MTLNPIRKLWRSADGSAIIEFALIGPIMIGLFMGVLQVGVGMQNYNAMRGISADVARHAVVNYQTKNRLSAADLQDYARSTATTPPYGLVDDRFRAHISLAGTQRVAGATEYTMTLNYRVPTVLAVIGIDEIPLTYTRPIFVIAATPAPTPTP